MLMKWGPFRFTIPTYGVSCDAARRSLYSDLIVMAKVCNVS
jgi:hypothetical protein